VRLLALLVEQGPALEALTYQLDWVRPTWDLHCHPVVRRFGREKLKERFSCSPGLVNFFPNAVQASLTLAASDVGDWLTRVKQLSDRPLLQSQCQTRTGPFRGGKQRLDSS
jgi:hypothetical protein